MLSKKQKNRLSTILKTKKCLLIKNNNSEEENLERLGKNLTVCTPFIVELMQMILKEKMIYGIDYETFENLLYFLERYEKGEETFNNIEFKIFYGAFENVTFRSLIYPIPLFELCIKIKQILMKYNKKISYPKIKLIFMNNFSSRINELNKEKCFRATEKYIDSLKKIVNYKYKELINTVEFFYDTNEIFNFISTNDFEKIYDEYWRLIQNTEEYKTLVEFGKGRSTIEESVLYSAVHSISQDSDFFDFTNLNKLSISVGGKSELVFLELRRIMNQILKQRISNINTCEINQIILDITTPPYLLLDKDDLKLEELLKNVEVFDELKKYNRTLNVKCKYAIPVVKAYKYLVDILGEESLIDVINEIK